jgi:biopolymer transport protein ExbD
MTTHALAPRARAASAAVLCDMNITPLIDVMLVLLVTLIVSLPIMTHAVKLNVGQSPPAAEVTPPEVVELDIDFDGAIEWNGTVVSPRQLESYLHAAAQKDPQPEIHLHPDRFVKYDIVAQVLALAQHSRMEKIGFVNSGEYQN